MFPLLVQELLESFCQSFESLRSSQSGVSYKNNIEHENHFSSK